MRNGERLQLAASRCVHRAEHVSLGSTLRAAEHLWLLGGPCADTVKLGFDPDASLGRAAY